MPISRSALMIVAAMSLALSACDSGNSSEQGQKQEEKAVPVQVATVHEAAESGGVVAYGTLRSDKEAALSFKISGLLKTLQVDTGDRIAKGEVLAELDMREIDAQADRAASAVEKARRDVERLEPLVAKGFVSRQRIQDARTALDMAVSDRQAVEFNRSLARIVAPSDGIVLSRHVDVNEIVAPGTPILTVSQGAAGYILKAAISDRDVARLRIGDSAEVRLDAFPGQPVQGTVRRIAAASEARTGTFEIEIALENVPVTAASGFMGEARIRPAAAQENLSVNLAIPASAIVEGHGATATVYVVDPASSIVRQTRIGIAGIVGENVIVTGGLARGELVVSIGAPYLREGAKVKITNGPDDAPPAGAEPGI
jgi:RND family efflux transporter MFP subunit